jgi:hypothetical protein
MDAAVLSNGTTLHCTALHYTALHCTAPHSLRDTCKYRAERLLYLSPSTHILQRKRRR